MNLQLKKPLVVFDLETTGISVSTDRIIELAYIKLFPDGKREDQCLRFHPEMAIPPESSKIHGIFDADVEHAPKFKEKAKELAELFAGCDFAGFNSNKFDYPMLVEEFLRAGVEFETTGRKFVDAQRIFHMMEQRTLAAAYKFYCNKELINAHSAAADTDATLEVLMAQLDRYPDLKNEVEFLHTFSGMDRMVDLAGRIVLNEKKEPVFNFGKHRNKTVQQVFKTDMGYYKWMMDGDFSLDTKRKLTQLYIETMKK